MKTKLVKKASSEVEVTVTFTTEEWQGALEKAFKKLAKNVTVKGFRKGKAPEALARKEVKQESIFNEALGNTLEDSYRKVLDEYKLIPLLQPGYEIPKLSDTELEIVFKLVVAPEIKLGAYKDLKIGHEEVSVDDASLDARLLQLREQNATLILKEGKAELGDTVVIDFEGFTEGKAFEGGKGDNFNLELGSGQFIPGFEDQLVGSKAGDKLDVNVTFPENYVEELKGKDATFKVSVHEVKTKEVPELDDEFAKGLNLPNVEDVVSLRMHVYGELDRRLQNEERSRYIDKILDNLRETSKIELAAQIIENEAKHMEQTLNKQVAQQGMSMESYLEMSGQTKEELDEKFKVDAKRNLENYLIINEIAKLENIEVTDEIVDFEIAKMAMQYNMEEARVRELLGDNISRLREDVRHQMIMNFLVENNE
ncbi:MAG: trigger factor [Erysipelotrichaceae bacterium]|jgi:trigger factor|nr:trigger factor [Bacillota bacterium]MDY0118818.1 trigger factor [Bacilli bacterium]NLJ32726.1 trigger factor [Erysipelotrichaceae bacterium]